jgi:hypothetical protein
MAPSVIRIKHLLALAVVGLGIVVVSGPVAAATAQDATSESMPDTAIVQPARTETVIYADDQPQVFERARKVRDALGLPKGARSSGKHVRDGYRNEDYDEVDEVDAAGNPVSLTQIDASGRLLVAVRLDLPGKSGRSVGRQTALARAKQGLAAAGVAPSAPATITANDAIGGWDVRWERQQDGYRVRGDEASVHLWDDGTIASIGRTEHLLARQPSVRLEEAKARASAKDLLDKSFDGTGSSYVIGDMDLEWAGPNAAFDADKLNAPEAPYRLCWVVNVTPTGDAASYARLLTLYLDAGDGSLLGGDVVE